MYHKDYNFNANFSQYKMIPVSALVFSALITSCWCEDLTFPPGFQFGVASSSYQIEGAWNISGKGESMWDRFIHKKHSPGQDNGDVACDSYHLWRRDVEMIEELGVNFYRFSISWPRILPNGFANHINKEGAKYYSDLIDALLEKGIEPVVTLYHWDLPQRLQDLGGWTNPLISSWFADYARIVFSLYADRVKTWITINEPIIACDLTYLYGILAPGIISPEGSLLCGKQVLMAHAKAWRIYDEEFRGKYHGRVSLTNFEMWFEPLTKEDEGIAELAQQHYFGLYSHPIFSKEGGWPPAVEKLIAENSKKLGYARSNLPSFTNEEIELLKGTYDFFALNYYTSRTIRRANASKDFEPLEPWIGDAPQLNAKLGIDPTWEITDIPYYPKHPEGMRKQLRWVKKEYGDLPIIIAENGFGNHGGLDDQDRIQFFKDHLKQVLLAIKEDGVNVTAFTIWSLMDSFEWVGSFSSKLGLYEVDFTSPDRKRTPRASAFFYTNVIRSGSLDVPDVSVTLHASTQASMTSTYLFIIGGVLLALAILAVVVYQVRRHRMPPIRKYTGVETEELNTRGP